MVKILIVDDSAFARERLQAIFVGAGHDVVGSVGDGDQALALYTQLVPDLVTLDYVMTNKSGEDVLKEIIQYDPDARVIMISGTDDDSIEDRALKAGAKAFFEKFHRKRDILKVIDRVLET